MTPGRHWEAREAGYPQGVHPILQHPPHRTDNTPTGHDGNNRQRKITCTMPMTSCSWIAGAHCECHPHPHHADTCRGNGDEDDMVKMAPTTTMPMTGEGTGGQAQHLTATPVSIRSQGGLGANSHVHHECCPRLHTISLANKAVVLFFSAHAATIYRGQLLFSTYVACFE